MMSEQDLLESDLRALETRIEALIHVCVDLKAENDALHERHQALTRDLNKLRKANLVACRRAEALLEKR